MTNDFHEHEFENSDLGGNDDEQRLQPRGFKSNLTEAWRTRPMFKLLVLMIVAGAIVAGGIGFFSSHKSSDGVATMVNPPSLHEAPGGPASPFVQDQTRLANEQRAQEALDRNGSALPTPLGQSSDIGDLLNRNKNDPLNELRNEVQQLQQKQQQMQQQEQPKPVQQVQQVQQKPPEQWDDSLAQAMQRQMAQLMDGWKPAGIKQVTVIKAEENKTDKQSAESAVAAATLANAQQNASQARTIVPAGTVSYAQLLTEANSDVQGPILAQIVSGPLAGARAVGSFQVTNSYDDYLVLSFTLASLKGKEYRIRAVALDPDTTLGGLATEVDERYFARVVLPAAAGFLQGFGSALGENSVTTTTNGNFAITQQAKAGVEQGVFQGLGNAAQTTSQFFQNQANLTKPLVRVAAGTPIGMFFVATVLDDNGQAGGYANGFYPGQYGNNQNGFPGQQGGPSGPQYVNSVPYGSNPNVSNNPYGNSGFNGNNNYGYNNGYNNNGMNGSYPGSTVSGYGNQANPSNVPYPNASAPYQNTSQNTSNGVNPYSTLSVTPGIGSYNNH